MRFGALIKGHAFLEERDDDSSEILEVQDLKTTWGDLTDASGSLEMWSSLILHVQFKTLNPKLVPI